MKNIKSNIWKLYAINFFKESIFFIPIMVPFLSDLGFSMQDIFIFESAFALTLVLFEIPSGYFADLYGRKKSLVIGSLFGFFGIAVFVFADSFWGFLIGEILVGVGTSFCSGAEEALVYETLLESKENDRYKKVQGNLYFYARISSTFSNIVGAFLGAMFLRLPFYATLMPFALWVLVSFMLVEPKHHKKSFEKWGHFVRICRESLIENKKLRYFLIYVAIPPAFFLAVFWLYQSYMSFVELPIFYFGFVVAVMNIASGLGAKYAKEIEEKLSLKLSLVMIPVLCVIAWIIFASVKSLWVIPLVLITPPLWGFIGVLSNDFVNKIVTSDRRATVISIGSFLTRGVFLVLAPFLGWFVDIYTVQTAFLVASVLLFVMTAVSLISLRVVKVI